MMFEIIVRSKDVVTWHKRNGGFPSSPRGHALRLLHEVVELCGACGATPLDIYAAMEEEIKKGRFEGLISIPEMEEEFADCAILLGLLQEYFIHDANALAAIDAKMKKNEGRRWKADDHGVLWRDRDDNQEQD